MSDPFTHHAPRITPTTLPIMLFHSHHVTTTFSPMPELPEVEVLVRHLAPLLEGRTIRAVHVRRAKVLAPTSTRSSRGPCSERSSAA